MGEEKRWTSHLGISKRTKQVKGEVKEIFLILDFNISGAKCKLKKVKRFMLALPNSEIAPGPCDSLDKFGT